MLKLRGGTITHVGGERDAIEVEAVDRVRAGRLLIGNDVGGGVEKAEGVLSRREQAGDVVHLAPGLLGRAAVSLAVFDLDLQRAGAEGRAAAVRPQLHLHGVGAAVGLSFDVDVVGFASQADVDQLGQRAGRLLDGRGELVAAAGDGGPPRLLQRPVLARSGVQQLASGQQKNS